MSHQNSLFSDAPKRQSLFSWKVMAVLAVAVVCAAVFIVSEDAKREEERMLDNMKGRAEVLIWALEGSARSMGSMRQGPMPALVEEVAKQPGLVYIAVLAADGRILVHSDPAQTGTQLHGKKELEALAVGEESKARFISNSEGRVLEVYKAFTPLRLRKHGTGGPGPGSMKRWRHLQEDASGNDVSGESIFIGMDAAHFDARLQAHVRHTGFMAALITLAGFVSVTLLFYMQNYKLSKQMLADTQALATQVISSHPAALVVTDTHGIISLSNRHGQMLLGLSEHQEGPASVHDLPFLDWQSLMDELDAGTVILERNTDLFLSKTSPLPVSISAVKIIGSEGGFSGYLFIVRDLAEIRRLQKQVKQSERLSALGNLAAGVAHEIRNPLSSIKGYATYLTEKVKDDKMAYATGHILIQETERLNRVVSDLLSVARPLDLRLQSARITAVLEQAVRVIVPDAEAKGVQVHLQLLQEGVFSRSIMLDADRLVQALLNLLVNAVQATEPGGSVLVGAESCALEGNEHFLAISVTDTGCGMSAQTLGSLFTPYFTTKASGTGLGLTIAQQIVEQHGGELKVFSQPGKGATFTILLPWADEERSRA